MRRAPARAARAMALASLALVAATALGGCGAAPVESVVPRASDSDLLGGLIAHWSFDEKDGSTTVPDRGPQHKYNGQLTGGAWDPTGGRFGGALHLQSGDSVTINPFPEAMPAAWTISVWIKVTADEWAALTDARPATAPDRAVLLSCELPSMGGWEIEFDLRPGFQYLEASYYVSSPINAYVILDDRRIDTDRWMQFTVVSDSAMDSATRGFRLYHDGRRFQSATPPKAPLPGDMTLSIGRWTQGSRPLLGTIDDFAIWGRALSDDEIATLNARAVPDSP